MSIKNIINSFVQDNPDIDINEININVDDILRDAKDTNLHLRGKTVDQINEELFTAVGNDTTFYDKLKNDYRLVNSIDELHIGKYVRWFILKKNGDEEILKLFTGAVVVKIIPTNNDNHKILCKMGSKYTNFIFENTIVFQKLSLHEIMILEFADNNTTVTPFAK
jgi:hypothetical protein